MPLLLRTPKSCSTQDAPGKPLDVVTKCIYTSAVEFEWDEAKRKANVRKHGLDFVDAQRVFTGVTVTTPDDREDYGEDRFVTVGLLMGIAVVIVHTERRDAIRVISMRRATQREERNYYEAIGN
jgi:hypothetical protein